jgi:betaine-aldehyde dehydrogenase
MATIGLATGPVAVAKHWIDGAWRDSAKRLDSFDPATGDKIGSYAVGGVEEAEDAVAAASRAFRETDWKSNRELRAGVLLEMADRFEARAADLIQAICDENGKVRAEATFEVSLAGPGLRYAASLVTHLQGRADEGNGGRLSLLVREPIGVAGISVPWNAPVALLVRSLGPALAAGCTTVVKMAGQTAQVNALISEVLVDVKSLPRGVVNMITGEREVLSYLVESPHVPTISFTGSTETGRAISRAGAARLKRFGLELGGKTPMIVFDDADLGSALPALEKALTTFGGQFCMAGSRLLVQRGIAHDVRRGLAARLEALKVGPASDPSSQMGPMIDRANVQRIDEIVSAAIASGGRAIVRGGPITQGPLARGAFYRPTLLEVTDPKAPVVQHEVFGPVLTLQVFDSEAEAIALANDSDFGLAASIWTRDSSRQLRVARDIEAGTIWINGWGTVREEFEEGGYKQSGRGRLRGLACLDDFVEYKHIVL